MVLRRVSGTWVIGLAVMALVATLLSAPVTAEDVVDSAGGVLGREPQMTPADLGDGTFDGMQFADPTAGLSLIDPPQATNQGNAELGYPLLVPPGRADVHPDLALSYDSSDGNGWVGVGWDLGVGEVSIDTRWGAPRYLPDLESETYVLDGEVLAPTAVRSDLQARQPERADWTRRVEDEFERIIRHGSSPADYWWEVTDKVGTTRFYGGTPEGTRDPDAILSDDAGNAYRWALSGVRDISSNVMRLSYVTEAGERVGSDELGFGRQLYLDTILYTGTLADGLDDDPAYQVRFLRDDAVSPSPTPRPDVIVDAIGGFAEVTSDLLRRVEVRYGAPNGGAARSYDTLVGAYDLHYTVGAYGKSLLTSVDQLDGDNAVAGTHTFDYHDDVRDAAGSYTGFAEEPWTVPDDDLGRFLLFDEVQLSALGASETNGGDVHAYIGFNPAAPGKTGSFGGAVTIAGGATEGLAELLDLNGDGLPDKVFRESRNGPVQFRLNQSGPDGGTTFGPATTVANLTNLSTEYNVAFGGSVEAHLGLSAQFSVAGDVTVGEDYFADVNADGLPDYVNGGTVWFNYLNGATPTFTTDSGQTPVPIDDGTLALPTSPELAELEATQRSQSPLADTVRRWTAPYDGTVAVTGQITLDPTPAAGVYTGDGVRVAVQHRGSELWHTDLTTPGQSATPESVDAIAVTKGDHLYFRVGSIDDGARDQVTWDPIVTYTSLPADQASDVNGLDQRVFTASHDFTTAGRPGALIAMPLEGTVAFEATMTKTAPTTDDITVLVLRNGAPVVSQVIPASATGDITIDPATFTTAAPSGTTIDEVEVRLAVDSPIDVTALQFTPRLYYTDAVSEGEPVQTTDPDGDPIIVLAAPYDIDIYPQTNRTAPVAPYTTAGGTRTIRARVTTAFNPDTPGTGRVVLTVKTRDGLVAKAEVDMSRSLGLGQIDLQVPFQAGEEYFLDVSIRDPLLSGNVTSAVVGDPGPADSIIALPSTLNWAGPQGIFPIAHRGWAYAGYNADGALATAPIDETAFVFQRSDYPETEPTGFDDAGYDNPAQGDAFPFTATTIDLLDAAGEVTGTAEVWRGFKDSMVGAATFARASRTASESPGMVGSIGGAGARAPRLMGLTGPSLALVLGVGPLGVSAGTGQSRGLVDFVDLNGDDFPDVVSPGSVQYTGPRGGFVDHSPASADVSSLSPVNQDTTFAVSGGFAGSAVEVKGNAKGDANVAQDTAASSTTTGARQPASGSASTGEDASADEYGASVGGALDISVSATNPIGDGAAGDAIEAFTIGGTLEHSLDDVNGDGLPDRIEVTQDGVDVYLNYGYTFSPTPIRWATGGFETTEAYAGSVGPTLGFSINAKEFSGGLSLNEAIDFPRYAWVDVDGDGVLDRLRKDGGSIRVAFGSGAGLQAEVDYGDFVEGEFDLDPLPAIATGQQVATGRSSGAGGGFDFTISIGPLCIAACYLIINPGVHYERTISNTQVQLTDVNGDGYPDSVRSTSDDDLQVRLNTRGRTHLLQSVDNPLGGQIRLDYTRDGNTEAMPLSQWVLASVEIDDGRSGDGPDVMRRTFTYSGNVYNPLEREVFGYDTVVEEHRDPADDTVLRSFVRTYRNATVFDAGLQTSESLLDADGTQMQRTDIAWGMIDLAPAIADRTVQPADDIGPVSPTQLAQAFAPVRTQVDQRWYAGGTLGQVTQSDLSYDGLGNVVRIVDRGEDDSSTDDRRTEMTYPDCTDSSWVSVPATVTVTDAMGEVLRHRDGSLDLCDNSVPIELIERIGGGEDAVTTLTFDDHGNYNSITYPANADGEAFTVDYVYDPDRHTDIATVTDSHGLTATATYDGPTGQVASRTDPNGHTTSYTYDALGRLASITGPYQQGTGEATVTFAYHPTASDYAYATAHHIDAFNPGDAIDTATFVDGMGRETQTKQDATVFRGADTPAVDVVVVGGAVEFDALGRPVREWYPIEEPLGTLGTYNTGTSATPSVTEWDAADRVTRITEPNGAVTTLAYGFGQAAAPSGPTLFQTTMVDAEGTPQVTYTDVRDDVIGSDVGPVDAPLRTRYAYDPVGQLLEVIDPGGDLTTHRYDLLGRRTATTTPDGGLRESIHDAAGNVIEFIDPVGRDAGLHVFYDYDIDRLVGIDYTDGTPDVSYTYGDAGAAGNGAGRVVAVLDGAREQTLTYDPLGAVASETSTMQVHNLNDGTEERLTFTTAFTYDAYGRLATLDYPDGEVVTHDYDRGGLLASVQGAKAGHDYPYVDRMEYDEFFDRRHLDLGNGAATTTTFDPDSRRLDQILTTTPTREVQDLNYDYDLVGNVLGMQNLLPPPTPSLMGGPSTQSFDYDPYYRLTHAEGRYEIQNRRAREYRVDLSYDIQGNLIGKSQLDEIINGRNRLVQRPTTYDLAPQHEGPGPHQVTRIGTQAYSHDLNGNATGWTDDVTGQRRTVAFDAEDRITSVADNGSTTRYTYDERNRLAIERGPGGETSFVNRWATVRNGTVMWKHIFAGDLRIATQRAFDDGSYEHMRYFMHPDLQGSTNIVTAADGLVFQHLEYFPAGEIWVHEHSDVHRTPYLYTDGYFDEFRDLINLGSRWYDPREQTFTSPDPVLYADPDDVIGDPGLLSPYAYAQANPLRLVDRSGRQTTSPRASLSLSLATTGFGAATAAAGAGVGLDASLDPAGSSSRVRAATAAPDSRRGRVQAFAERFDAKPLLQFNLTNTGDGWQLDTVKLAPLFAGPQFTVAGGAASPAADAATTSTPSGADAADAQPGSGGAGPQPGAGGAAAVGGGALDAGGTGPAAGGGAAGSSTASLGGGSAPTVDAGAP